MANGDPIKDLYNATKGTKIFLDENDFREQLLKSPQDVYKVISGNQSTKGLFLDYSDFENITQIKKKVGGNGSGYGVNPFDYSGRLPEKNWAKAPGLKQEQPTNEFGAIENVLVENKTAGDRVRTAKSYDIQAAAMGTDFSDADKYSKEADIYNKQTEDAKNAVLKVNKEKIIKPVQDLIKSGEYKQFINESGVFDYNKARNHFKDYVEKRGGGTYTTETMVATMKQAAEMERDRPEFEKLLGEEYKKQGIDVSKYGQSLFDKQVAPKINSLENMKAEAKQNASEYFEQIKPLAKEIGGQYEQQVAQLNEAYKNGAIQETDANAQLKTINDDYLSKINELDKNYSLNIKELNKKVSDKYSRINDEIKIIGESITSDKVWASIPAEEKKKIQIAQESAQGRLRYGKNKAKEAEDFAAGVVTGNPLMGLFTKSVMSGWNTGLADFGDYLSFKGFDNRMVRGLQGKRTKAEELSPAEYSWSENPFMRAVTSSGTSLGASLPTTGAAIGVTLASGGLGLPGLVTTIAGGLTGFTLEKAQNTGGVYRDILEQTQDPSLAIAGAADFNEKQVKTLPLYFISAVGLQNLLKGGLKKTAIGTTQELGEELPTEYYQGFTQAQATQGYKGDFGQYVKENPQLTLDVIAGTLGQSGAISMASKTYQALFKKAPSPQVQFYTDMIQKGGVNVAITNLQQQLDNDIITTEEYKNELAKVQQVVSTLGKVEELGLKGDNAKAFLTFSEQVKELQSKAEAEPDPAVRMLHEEKVKDAKAQLTEIAKGEGVYAVVTMPGGNDQTLIMPVESVTDSIIKKAEKVTIKNDQLANKEIQEKKKELGIPEDAPDGMYKANTPPPIQPQEESQDIPLQTPTPKGNTSNVGEGSGGVVDVDFTAKGGNKIVDDKGSPLKVYHGTNADFTEFKPTKSKRTMGGLMEYDVTSPTHFFTADKNVARNWAENRGGNKVKEVYVSIKNPLDLTEPNDLFTAEDKNGDFVFQELRDRKLNWSDAQWKEVGIDPSNMEITHQGRLSGLFDNKEFVDALKEKGFDGVIFSEGKGDAEGNSSKEFEGISYGVFSPSQIKKPDVETSGEIFTVERTKVENKNELSNDKGTQTSAKETNDTKSNSGDEANIQGGKKKTNTIGGYEFTKSPTLEGVIIEPTDKRNNAIIEKQMFADENKNVLTNGVKYIGGGWYEIGGDNFGSVVLYNTVSKEGVSLNHKQGGRMGVVVQDFIKNNSRYNDNIAVRGSKFTQEEHNPKFGGSGHYKGTYFYVGLNAESKALEHGKNVTKVDLESANLYEIGVDGITSQTLKNEAKKAGYDTRDASGYSESEYLKKQGYDGIKRGNEVVLFEPKKFEVKAVEQSLSTPQPKPGIVEEGAGVGGKRETAQSRAKKVYKDIGEIDEPSDARGLALEYLAGGGKVNEIDINDIAGSVKRASLNTGAKEKKSSEVKAKDYTSKNSPSIERIAEDIWQALPEELQSKIDERDIRNELMDVVNSHNTRLSAATEFRDRYIGKEFKKALTEAEAADMEDGYVRQLQKIVDELPENQQSDLIELLREYQDEYGFVDWGKLEKDSNGFDPNILSLPIETQKALDGIIQKNIESGQGKLDVAYPQDVKGEKAKAEERLTTAQSEYNKAAAELKKAEDKISKTQGTQTGMFNATQKEMFGVDRQSAKEILDPLRIKVKEAKVELDNAQKVFDNISEQPKLTFNETTLPTTETLSKEESGKIVKIPSSTGKLVEMEAGKANRKLRGQLKLIEQIKKCLTA